ncbi:MAG: methyltransferase domain-containing protein [Candidatus Caenarcaniphilales bacterium]|nr:methyltransferase domain-containing protein [Candidatus Caenarcaniphilales bacterium]
MTRWDAHVYDTSLKYVADYGKELVDLLNPQKGESILDLGCGTGELSREIAKSGAIITGLDNSESMLEKAKSKNGNIKYLNQDITSFQASEEYDAIFSNAVLHWITNQDKVLENLCKALKPNGRLVVELGAKDNVATIIGSIQELIKEEGYPIKEVSDIVFFPSIAEYATLLESKGFWIESISQFKRPTLILDGVQGFINWINVFGIILFENVPKDIKPKLIEKAANSMARKLEKDERYFADYVRLRVVARKSN